MYAVVCFLKKLVQIQLLFSQEAGTYTVVFSREAGTVVCFLKRLVCYYILVVGALSVCHILG